MVGDEAELYRLLARRVERIVRSQVHAPPELIEDACHHAWAKLINHSEQVSREAVMPWLATTALREAWKLDRRERREASLDAAADHNGESSLASALPGPHERLEQRERLGEVTGLSERQQRLVWLRALGLSYVEMAAYTGDTVRTVERQIVRAGARMRQAREQSAQADRARVLAQSTLQRTCHRGHDRDERGIER